MSLTAGAFSNNFPNKLTATSSNVSYTSLIVILAGPFKSLNLGVITAKNASIEGKPGILPPSWNLSALSMSWEGNKLETYSLSTLSQYKSLKISLILEPGGIWFFSNFAFLSKFPANYDLNP